ncbi:MAG: endonuclease NucS domain-containing protein [Acidobacteriaceae bacterium]
MPTKIKAWEVADSKLIALQDQAISFTEAELEKWLFEGGDVFGEGLLVLCRQLRMSDGGRLDMLCMDVTGRLVILELKRELGTREALAQVLDYGSWIDAASADDIRARAEETLNDLGAAFEQKFDAPLPEDWSCERPRLVLVAVGIDEAAERMIGFLAKKYKVDVSAVMFNHARTTDGRQFLFRSVVAAPAPPPPPPPPTKKLKPEDLLAVADRRKTAALVQICRQMSPTWWEECAGTSGGSFRYWAALQDGGFRMVFGVNTSGELANPEPGDLDVWIRTAKLAQVTGNSEEAIKETLAKIPSAPPFPAGMMNFVIRLKTPSEAEALVKELQEVAASRSKSDGVPFETSV